MEGDQQAESEASGLMAIEVETKDCTMLGDAEIEEMADLCAEGPNPIGIGLISSKPKSGCSSPPPGRVGASRASRSAHWSGSEERRP